MELAFQWCGFGHGQWCHFLLAGTWFVSVLHNYKWDFSEHACLFPSCPSIMKLSGQRVYVFYILIDFDKLFRKCMCHCVLPLMLLQGYVFPPDPYHRQILPIKNILPVWWIKKIIYFFAICIFLLVDCLFISFPHFLPGCLSFFFFNEFERSLCIFRTDKGRGSGVRLPVSEPCLCHLLTVTLGELSDFFAPQFPHLLHEVNNNKLIIIVRVR